MTAATLTLTDFLLARIAEDEAAAKAVLADMPRWDSQSWGADVLAVGGGLPGPQFSARMSPVRVLAECEAKRRIVEPWRVAWSTEDHLGAKADQDNWLYGIYAEALDSIHRVMAAVYADHPDYRDEWRV